MDTKELIERSFDERSALTPGNVSHELLAALDDCLELLGSGRARVAEPVDGGWRVNEWLKKAVLLYFRTHDNVVHEAGAFRYYDKLPLKYSEHDLARFRSDGSRIVPGAIVRSGAFVARDAVLMPCFVNVGAYVGEGTMVDTWATVGSCAQVGRNVHLSGGVGIGGVLEPLQAQPTIIEDDCFIGARSEVVEGVVVERGAVLSMGVFIGSSTRIYDRDSGEITYGRVPAGSVVVPGSLPASDGSHSLYCAVIVKKVDAQTRAKTSINELLRTVRSAVAGASGPGQPSFAQPELYSLTRDPGPLAPATAGAISVRQGGREPASKRMSVLLSARAGFPAAVVAR